MTTVDSVPEDMPELTRQKAHLQTPSAGHRDPVTGEWESEDPFAPGNVVGDLAEKETRPSARNVELPGHPNITIQAPDPGQPQISSGIENRNTQADTQGTIRPDVADAGEYDEFKANHFLPDIGRQEDAVYHSPIRSDSSVSIYSPIPLQCRTSLESLLPGAEMSGRRNAIAGPSRGDAFGSPWKFTAWRETTNEVPSSQPDSPASSSSNRSPNMGERELFELKRSLRNMRYNAITLHAGSEDHEDDAKPPSAFPSPLRPRLCINTGEVKYGRRSPGTSPKKDLRHSDVGMSSDSVDAELKDMVAQHYHFKDHIDSLAPEDAAYAAGGLAATAMLGRPSAESTENPFSPASEAYSSHISPNSKRLWAEIQQNPFDTPPAVSPSSQHHRETQVYSDDEDCNGNDEKGAICTYDFESPGSSERVLKDSGPPTSSECSPQSADAGNLTDSLDECLEMFRSFNRSRGQLPTQSSEATMKGEDKAADNAVDPFSSPDSGYDGDRNSVTPGGGSGSPGRKKPLPARYRSIKGTVREGVDDWAVRASPPRKKE